MAKRKTRDGRVLPDGVSERGDGRFLYRYKMYGKQHYIYDRDLNELKKKIEVLKIDIAKGRDIDLANLSLNQYYPQYLDNYKEGRIKQASFLNKQKYFDWYIRPFDIGAMPMREIKRTHVISHFQYLADKKGLSDGTLKTLASMLGLAMQEVIYDGGVFVNPFLNVMENVTAKPKVRRIALTREEQNALIEYLKREGEFQTNYLPIIGILLGTAMRIGEALALTWNDIDFEHEEIHVSKTMNYRTRVEGGGHEFYITTPKTPNAVRDIPMSADVKKLFQDQQSYQKNLRIRSDISIPQRDERGNIIKNYKGFVFTTKLGYPFTHEGFTSTLRRIVKNYNEMEVMKAKEENRKPVVLPDITAHVFRHTACTRMIEQGIPPERTQIVMGHASIKTTLDIYTTVSKDIRRKVKVDLDSISNIF